jgi:hypothetical protein
LTNFLIFIIILLLGLILIKWKLSVLKEIDFLKKIDFYETLLILFGRFTWIFPISTIIIFLGYPEIKPIFISLIFCFFYYIKNNFTGKEANTKSYFYFFSVIFVGSYFLYMLPYLLNFLGLMLSIEHTFIRIFRSAGIYSNKSGWFITLSPVEGPANPIITNPVIILTQAKENEYCSFKPVELRKMYSTNYFVIMNELEATFQHKLKNNIITRTNISEGLDGLIATLEGPNVPNNISVRELILIRYIATNYPLTEETKPMLRAFSNNDPFSSKNQPSVSIFASPSMNMANKSKLIAELKDIKRTSFNN